MVRYKFALVRLLLTFSDMEKILAIVYQKLDGLARSFQLFFMIMQLFTEEWTVRQTFCKLKRLQPHCSLLSVAVSQWQSQSRGDIDFLCFIHFIFHNFLNRLMLMLRMLRKETGNDDFRYEDDTDPTHVTLEDIWDLTCEVLHARAYLAYWSHRYIANMPKKKTGQRKKADKQKERQKEIRAGNLEKPLPERPCNFLMVSAL